MPCKHHPGRRFCRRLLILPVFLAASLLGAAHAQAQLGHDQAEPQAQPQLSESDEHTDDAGRALSHEHATQEADGPHATHVSGLSDGPAPGEPPSHDHAAVHDQAEPALSFFNRLIAWLGKNHPMTVHFPIALLMAALLAEGLAVLTGREHFAWTGRFCAVLGGVAAVAAGVLGWFFGGFHLTDGKWADGEWLMTTHRWVGTSTALCGLLVAVLAVKSGRAGGERFRRRYRVGLVVSAGLVGAAGFFGGALIYGIDHLVW